MYKVTVMKFLKIILFAGAGLVLIFFSLGLIFPSYEYESSVMVKASPEKCWIVFHDSKKMSEWMDGFESLTLKNGEPMTPGSLYEIVVNDHNKRIVMSEKLIEVNAPTRVSYELNNEVLKSESSFSFEGTASTTIVSHYKITGNNILWKSILFASRSYMTRSGQEQLESLKKVIEKP